MSSKKYSEKVTVSLTKEDYAKLESILDNSRLSIGQLASTMVEDAINEAVNTNTTPA